MGKVGRPRKEGNEYITRMQANRLFIRKCLVTVVLPIAVVGYGLTYWIATVNPVKENQTYSFGILTGVACTLSFLLTTLLCYVAYDSD